jgi:hypothetical protein
VRQLLVFYQTSGELVSNCFFLPVSSLSSSLRNAHGFVGLEAPSTWLREGIGASP